MGFFGRLYNVISGFFNSLLGNIEAQNPELVYENTIQERLKQQKELKKAVSGIVHLRTKTEHELKEKEAKLSEVDIYIETAMEEGDEETALTLIEQKDELETDVQRLRVELERCQQEAATAMEHLTAFGVEIQKLKREKDTMVARAKTAEARNKIAETIDGLSVDADTVALTNVRESINKKVAEADINAELRANTFDSKFEKIKAKSGNVKARRRLAELKAKRAAAAQGGAGAPGAPKRNI